jgi:hypothetical protein
MHLGLERREIRDAIGQQALVGSQVPALVGAAADGPAGLDDRQARALRSGVNDVIRLAEPPAPARIVLLHRIFMR